MFTYRNFGQTLTVDELETFANTGVASPKVKFFLRISGQDPEQARKFMTEEAKISLKLADRLLNIIPGELYSVPNRTVGSYTCASGQYPSAAFLDYYVAER